LPKVKE